MVSDFRFRHRKCHFWSFPFKYADKCDNFVVEYFSGCVVHFQVIWGLGLTRNLFRNVSTMWDILQKERTPSATKIHCLHLSSISMISKLKAKTCVNILWSQLTRKVLPSPPLCPASCLGLERDCRPVGKKHFPANRNTHSTDNAFTILLEAIKPSLLFWFDKAHNFGFDNL